VSGFYDAIADNDTISHFAKKCTPRSGHVPFTGSTEIPIETLYERSTEFFRREVEHPVTINLQQLLDLVPITYYDRYQQDYCEKNKLPEAAVGVRETARHSHTGFAIRVMLKTEVFISYYNEISQVNETAVIAFEAELKNLINNVLRTMKPDDIAKMFRCAEDNLVAYYCCDRDRLSELKGYSEVYTLCLWVKRAIQTNVVKVSPLIEPPCMMCKWQFIDKFMGLLSGEGLHIKCRYIARETGEKMNGDPEFQFLKFFYDKVHKFVSLLAFTHFIILILRLYFRE
jgi:hypothetical protein